MNRPGREFKYRQTTNTTRRKYVSVAAREKILKKFSVNLSTTRLSFYAVSDFNTLIKLMIILYLNSPFHKELEALLQLTGINSNGAHQFAI